MFWVVGIVGVESEFSVLDQTLSFGYIKALAEQNLNWDRFSLGGEINGLRNMAYKMWKRFFCQHNLFSAHIWHNKIDKVIIKGISDISKEYIKLVSLCSYVQCLCLLLWCYDILNCFPDLPSPLWHSNRISPWEAYSGQADWSRGFWESHSGGGCG